MKKVISSIMLAASIFMLVGLAFMPHKSKADPCIWWSKAGTSGTWTEGSCYGNGDECKANICTGLEEIN